MEALATVFNYKEGNFWVTNPGFSYFSILKDFYKNDKTKGKSRSSSIMWAIALLIDPHKDNPYRNIKYNDRKVLIANEYLEEPDFIWEKYQPFIDEYEKRATTEIEQQLHRFKMKMEERQAFIDSTKYTLDSYTEDGKLVKGTADQLDKMVTSTTKITDMYEKLMDAIGKQGDKSTTKGGRAKSASEKGLL
jgi:hypothetical protein